MRRMITRCAAGFLTVMMSLSMVPVPGGLGNHSNVTVQASEKTQESSFSFGSGIAKKDLTPGVYEADVQAKKAGQTALEDDNLFEAANSMVSGCIDGAARVEIKEDGSAVVTMNLKAMTVMGITAWGTDWKVLSDGDSKAAAILEGTESEPSKIQFTVPDTTKNGVNVSVVSGGGRAQNVILAINWANMKKISQEPEIPVTPEKPVGKPQTVTVNVPASIKVSAVNYQKTKLTWSKVSNASGYEVYQNNKKIADVKTTSYTKSGLKTGSKYTYKVRAYRTVNGTKGYSSYTKTVSVTLKLSKVTKVKAANKKKKTAVITWKKVSGASGYRVYRSTQKNGKYKLVKTAKGNKTVTYTNKKLKKNQKYYYKVRAYRTVSGKKVFGAYSSKAKVTIKK